MCIRYIRFMKAFAKSPSGQEGATAWDEGPGDYRQREYVIYQFDLDEVQVENVNLGG